MLAHTLHQTTLRLRRARDPMAVFSTTVWARAQDLAKADTKNGQTPPVSDQHALQALRAALKSADENLQLLDGRTGDSADAGRAKAHAERALLLDILPKQASEEAIRKAAQDIIATTPPSKGLMGVVMKVLGDQFGASLDRQLASKVVKGLLS